MTRDPGRRPSSGPELPAGGGLLLVDKPAGCTSHDVVSRLRRVLGTRRIGHAGTLDPAATGLLVVAVERATKLLGHIALNGKTYTATIRLGAATDTDDADGKVVSAAEPDRLRALTEPDIAAGIDALTGELMQVPSTVSAIKINGRRAYQLARAGEIVELPARPVTVTRFEILGRPTRRAVDGPAGESPVIDVDVRVDCSSGTYIRALARDLGADLGVGGHLTRLRRTIVGPFAVGDAVDPFGSDRRAPISESFAATVAARIVPAADAVRMTFPVRTLDESQVADVLHGRWIPAGDMPGIYAGFASDGRFVALLTDREAVARPVLGWLAGS